jgi:hypothetical protein
MKSKIVNKEITNILASYLYNHNQATSQHSQAPTAASQQPRAFRNINRPLDSYLRSYFSAHKYLGSTERSTISDKVYNFIRYEYLLAHLIRSKPFDIDKQYVYG